MGLDARPAVPTTVAGRFRLDRLLKRGRGVSTFAGVDLAGGTEVVVKAVVADEVTEAVRLRLEHEAHVLRQLQGLDLPPLIAMGQEGDLLYLVQPFVPGVTLKERLAAGSLPVAEALHIAIDVLRTLRLAHDREVMHRDVKPANVIVPGGGGGDGGGPRAVLIDFGFARSAWLDASIRDEPVGSARYLAPEAAGALPAAVDERADLYAVGVLLFECLAGRPPFEGHDVGEVLRQHLTVPPPALRSLGVAVPRVLDAVIQRLLRKDPDERYQTAGGVLADLEDVAAALERGVDDPTFVTAAGLNVVVGARDRRQVLTEPAFVGRQAELAQLGNLLEDARGGRGGLVLLEAESGLGKSRLLDELVQQAGRPVWILRGQGVDQAAQRPFQLLDGVAQGILATAREQPALARALRLRLLDRAHAAVAALPALAGVLAPGDQLDLGPEAYGELRSVDALAVLLEALGSAPALPGPALAEPAGAAPTSQPALVLLDDCQWADTPTLTLLARFAGRAARAGCHVLVVAAYRSEEVGTDHPLRALAQTAARIQLPPFGPADVRSLAESMAGPLPDEAVAVIARLSEGSPFLVSAVVRGLAESGALRHTPEGWEVDPVGMAHVQTSRRAALFLLRRLELLTPAALRLLTVGAVLGKEFGLGLAVDLADLGREEAAAALHEARRRRLVWVDEQVSRCSFLHDKIREALLGRLGDGERRSLHERAARRLESQDPERVFELAYHFDAAGRGDLALGYALTAGELARAQHSLEIAAVHYRIAERAAVTAGAATRGRVAEGLGDILTLQGRYEEAVLHFDHARSLARDEAHRAELEGKLGDVAFKRGDQRAARRHLEGALRALGRPVPGGTAGYLLALLWEVLVQAVHSLLPRRLVARRDPGTGRAARDFLAVRMYSRLAYVYWFHAGRVPCAWAHLREMNLAERYPPTPALAQAYSEHAPVMTMIPWYGRGILYAQRSLAIRRELGDVWGQGQSLHFYGVVLYAASRYEECIERCREAVRLLERTGDRWEVNTATWHIAFAHYRLGELREAVDVARRVHQAATDIGDRTAAGIALSAWSRASAGQVPADLVAAAADVGDGTEDAHTASEVHLADAVRLLARGRPAEAVARLEAADALVARAGLRQEYVAPVLPWLATALRTELAGMPPFDSVGRRRLRRRTARTARRAHRLARSYRNNLPHALRERGLVAAMGGHGRRARRWLDRSLAEAEAQGARYEAALSRRAWAEAGTALGWEGAAEVLEGAVAEAEALVPVLGPGGEERVAGGAGPAGALSLADRFAGLLAAGHDIAAAASVDAVHRAVRGAALALLRGEVCHVFELGEDGTPLYRAPEASDSGPPPSTTIVEEAVARRAPVVAGGSGGEATDSVLLAGLRSVLCAPILAGDQPVACFYVTHGQVGWLFSEEEVKLAEFVATLAGASLEHLAGTEARFRSLAQNSSDVITIVDRRGRIGYQSSSVERVFGLAPGELVGTLFSEWVHPDDREEAVVVTRQAGHGSGRLRPLLECRLRHADGSWRYVETALNDLFDDPSVRGLVLNSRDVSERHALEAELRDRALHDNLTGLANRGLFMDRVEHYLTLRRAGWLSIVYVDVDDFKAINDSLGHAAGDLLLRQIAHRLLACVRPQDTVARLGGDEFAILLEGAGPDDAEAVADRLLAAMADPFDLTGRQVQVRISIGLASAAEGPEDGLDADEMLSRADAAMYVAKASGKGHHEVFAPAMRAVALHRTTIKQGLERAVENGELVVHYQPVVALRSGAVVGFEALVRWRHPTLGLLPPQEFIGVAEESGLIVPLGNWVLHEACRHGRALQDRHANGHRLGMSVNVSTRQLQDPALKAEILAALAASGFHPEDLTLEITESASVADPEATIARLRELKALGVRLAIDDFGTGYSSLSHLRRFPVDQLKIDRSFVAGLGSAGEDTAIVGNVVGLAHALGLEAVAEGVERMEQHERVATLGCDLAQGFNWRRPMPIEEVEAWLGGGPPGAAGTPVARVVLVDDRAEVRAAVRLALELDGRFTVVAEAEDGREAIAAAARHQPDVILLDLNMPGLDGLQALPTLRRAVPDAAVVILTVRDLTGVPASVLDGVAAVLDKAVDLDALVGRLAAVVPRAA